MPSNLSPRPPTPSPPSWAGQVGEADPRASGLPIPAQVARTLGGPSLQPPPLQVRAGRSGVPGSPGPTLIPVSSSGAPARSHVFLQAAHSPSPRRALWGLDISRKREDSNDTGPEGGSDGWGPPEREEVEGGIKPRVGCGRGCPQVCPLGYQARASLRADPCQLPCPANRPVGQREAREASGCEVGGPRSRGTPGGSSGLPGARSGDAEGSRGRTPFLMHLTWTLEPWHLKDPPSAGATPGRPSVPLQVRGAMCRAHLGILAGEVRVAAALATQVSPSPHLPDRSRAQGPFPKVPGTQRFLVTWGQRARFHYKYFVVVHLLSPV